MMKETKENRIDAVRAFLIEANTQFEAQGIRLERVIFKRDRGGWAMKTVRDRHPKPFLHRTRSNPHNKRGGHRARDKPCQKPDRRVNANVVNKSYEKKHIKQ